MSKMLKWNTLRTIQKSKFVTSMYVWMMIVPIASKVLYKIERNLDFNIFNQKINILLSLPFSWKLFFFSALFFSIANTIILIFCPQIIKDHLSFGGFIGDGKNESHLEDYAKDIKFEYNNFKFDRKTPAEFTNLERHLRDNFWDIYKEANLSRTIRSIIANIFYGLGTILFLYVLFLNISWVFKIIF